MTETFPLLPEVEVPEGAPPPRICIASWEIAGPSRNAGIGTANTNLAEALKRAGYDVTVLYLLGSHCCDGNIVDWIEYYRTHKGITLVGLPLPHEPRVHAAWASSISYHSYTWLKQHQDQFDVVHFPECQGLAFYSLLAKRQGLAFRNTTFVITTHGPTFWVKEGSQDFLRNLGELEIDFMERLSVSAADIVISPTQYLLNWMQRHGWELPERTYVAPYILPRALLAKNPALLGEKREVNEIVFFGRLEIRKGLKLFCDAIDQLCACTGLPQFEITFLGRETDIYGRPSVAYISERSRRWSVAWRVISNRDSRGAIEYLRQPGRLAVISSLEDNFPNTVLECAGANVPLLATNVGGIPEVIAPEDRPEACFEPRPDVLAKRMRNAIENGASSVRPAESFAVTERKWLRWHASFGNGFHPQRAVHDGGGRSEEESIFPLVSVCLAYNVRENGLGPTLASLKQQDYPHFEIILAECGSIDGAPPGHVESLEQDLRGNRCRRISQESSELGAGRNAAAREAKGEYLLFVDDHTLLSSPSALSIFVQVAQRVQADVVTSTLSFVVGSSAKRFEHSRRPFLGGDTATGAFANCFGSSNALFRRGAFEALGGFSDDAVSTLDDWEIFAKAGLKGFRIETIPEVLVHYREDPDQDNLVHSFANAVRSVRPYTAPGRVVAPHVEQLLAHAVLYSQGLKFERDAMIGTPLSRGEQGPAVTG